MASLGIAAAILSSTPVARTPQAAIAFFLAGFFALAGGAVVRVGRGLTRRREVRGAAMLVRRSPRRARFVVTLVALGTFLVAGVGLGGGRGEPDAHDRAGRRGRLRAVRRVHATGRRAAGRAGGAARCTGSRRSPCPRARCCRCRGSTATTPAACSSVAPRTPALLGVDPVPLAARGAFTFVEHAAVEGSPWGLLRADLGPGRIPAVGDAPTLTWGLQSATAEVAILFKDVGEQTRLSVRTRDGGVDATELTGAFGGGGHARAAGATVELPYEQAGPQVLRLAQRLLDTVPVR